MQGGSVEEYLIERHRYLSNARLVSVAVGLCVTFLSAILAFLSESENPLHYVFWFLLHFSCSVYVMLSGRYANLELFAIEKTLLNSNEFDQVSDNFVAIRNRHAHDAGLLRVPYSNNYLLIILGTILIALSAYINIYQAG